MLQAGQGSQILTQLHRHLGLNPFAQRQCSCNKQLCLIKQDYCRYCRHQPVMVSCNTPLQHSLPWVVRDHDSSRKRIGRHPGAASDIVAFCPEPICCIVYAAAKERCASLNRSWTMPLFTHMLASYGVSTSFLLSKDGTFL